MSLCGPMGVLASGAVTPTGWGMPLQAVPGGTSEEALISRSEVRRAVARVTEAGPLWERWKREPRMRRAAPIARFMAEAVRQALEGARPARRGLIGCFSLGGIVFSRKFYEGMLRHGRALASPALFPETVYNSPLGHVAAVHGLDGPAYSLVGDESCWVSACGTAGLWLESGLVDEVVVVAGDEVDAVVLEGLEAAGWFRSHPGWVSAEGAAALRLGPPNAAAPSLQVAVPALPFGKGFPSLAERMKQLEAAKPPLCRVLGEGAGDACLESAGDGKQRSMPFPAAAVGGGSFSVSPAWASVAAVAALRSGEGGPLFQPVRGSSHGVGALLWE